MLTAADIKLPAVPRTRDDCPGEAAFAERASLMRADTVERVERAVDVEQRHDAVPRHTLTRTAAGTLVEAGHFDPLTCHVVSYLRAENDFMNVSYAKAA